MKYFNPVIPGFFPDPSICRVGDMFYMVCSSFQYFPGVPLFESCDLLNWKQIGNVLTRKSQLDLTGAGASQGLFAPTIRYNNGRFYMVTTHVNENRNFYVWTDDIHGEWSEPITVEQGGIDPSLYFEDGKAYFMSNGEDDNGVGGITQCEIDIETGAKLTNSVCIWKGAGGRYLESPHLYKINGTYYLMAAEGGTEYGHMIVYAKGSSIFGPFENAPDNPILTNRNLGGYQIQGVGHGDLVDDTKGNWWLVHLAFRQIDRWQMHHITGREVYLVPVTFDADGWFHAGENGTCRAEMETDRISDSVVQTRLQGKKLTFANTKPAVEWCYQRNPIEENYMLSEDSFQLKGTEVTIDDNEKQVTFIGIRQQEMQADIRCRVDCNGQEAGITLYMDYDQHYDFAVRDAGAEYEIMKRLNIGDAKFVQQSYLVAKEVVSGEKSSADVQSSGTQSSSARTSGGIRLHIRATEMEYYFEAEVNGNTVDFGKATTRYLSTEVAGGFTGVMIGLYAQTPGKDAGFATFDEFEVQY